MSDRQSAVPSKISWKTAVAIAVALCVLLFIFAGIAAQREEERNPGAYARRQAQREAIVEARRKAELAEKQAKLAAAEEERRSGFRCLSGWDGSNRSTVEQVKARLRDPSSFEHDETRIAPIVKGSHALVMTYRAKNGFGGTNVELAYASVDHETCQAQLLNIE